MKHFHFCLALAMTTLFLASCGENTRKKALLPNISGKAGEVIVVIDKSEWEGAIGTTIRDTLANDCPFLPQREPMYTLVDVAPGGFGSMFQIHRNIVIVNINSNVTSPGVVYQTDIWASSQCVIRLNAPDSETAVQIFKENSKKIITTLEQAERDRIIANSRKYEERSIAPVVSAMAGGSPHFPSGFRIKKQTDNFIWVSYDTQVSQGILIYKYPVEEGKQMLSLDNILEENAVMLKENVPGMFENTYMMTSDFARPSIEYLKYKGRDFASIRGYWEVYNDYMGGPFVAHAFYSRDGKNVIVMEGFVYAPKYDKRHYLRQVESILYSFEWAGEKAAE
ncbi:MAG: DUF4837 family protein [Candidatus Cryptobacteroides sp.]